MILLPGSLPTDRATLNALCENLPSQSELAKWLRGRDVETVDGSWSDWERVAIATALTPALSRAAREGGIATPFHATLGLSDLTPLDPAHLQLSEDDSRALCESCDAHLREDDLRLEFASANEWRVVTQRKIDVFTERPDWIIGESMRPNLPRGNDGRLVERWMNELQMLLFNHPVNAARTERRLAPVNMIWLWGFDGLTSAMSDAIDGRMLCALRAGDVATWQRAWGELESNVDAAKTVVLGDSRPRLKLTIRKLGLLESLRMKLRPPKLSEALSSLQSHL